MTAYILFYEGSTPESCNVLHVFKKKINAVSWLKFHGWKFDVEDCFWYHSTLFGRIEIIERNLI